MFQPALAAGVAINPGPESTPDKAYGKPAPGCLANPSQEAIRAGVAALAEVCRREFGVPNRIANVERAEGLTRDSSSPRKRSRIITARARIATTAADNGTPAFAGINAWIKILFST